MPEPPSIGFFTRYVLENPYPLSGMLAVLAIVLAWSGLREGRKGPIKGAAISAVAAGAVFAIAQMVTTPGEHGEAVTRALVHEVVAGNTQGAMAHFAPGAAFTVQSPQNPGLSIDHIRNRLTNLNQSYAITSNRITSIRGYGLGANEAEVHLTCRTEVSAGFGPTPSQWVLRVERGDHGQWLVTRLTAVSIAGRTPSERLW